MTGTMRDPGELKTPRAHAQGAAGPAPRFGVRRRLGALVAAVAVAAAACSSAGVAATPSPGASVEAALLAFSRCMRGQGIADMPDPTVDSQGNVRIQRPAGGHDSGAHDRFEAARNKCAKFLQGITQGFSHANLTQTQDRLLRLSECMRGRAVDVPDPDFSGGGHDPGTRFWDAINRSDPAVRAALRSCQQRVFGSEGFGHGGGH